MEQCLALVYAQDACAASSSICPRPRFYLSSWAGFILGGLRHLAGSQSVFTLLASTFGHPQKWALHSVGARECARRQTNVYSVFICHAHCR